MYRICFPFAKSTINHWLIFFEKTNSSFLDYERWLHVSLTTFGKSSFSYFASKILMAQLDSSFVNSVTNFLYICVSFYIFLILVNLVNLIWFLLIFFLHIDNSILSIWNIIVMKSRTMTKSCMVCVVTILRSSFGL